ncbi:MAG: aminodeoxychorismate lyase [Gallionella sp.]|jgi:4-amino-4-deoxychorismate lyase
MLINGAAGNMISIRDRGLLYGDGVFRTFCACAGEPQHWPLHYKKLEHDCAALGIVCPDFDLLAAELGGLLIAHPDAVFKIIVTRGLSARGYAPPVESHPTHIWDVSPLPDYSQSRAGLKLHLCRLRLGHQPLLAGIKHLNRLENVLAAAECSDADEGLLQDCDGLVIEGVRSNVFLVLNGCLVTPDLSRCGVAGVQRDRVIACAGRLGMRVVVRDVALAEVSAADELFLTNSVFGLWPVASLDARRWTDYSGTTQIREALAGQGF